MEAANKPIALTVDTLHTVLLTSCDSIRHDSKAIKHAFDVYNNAIGLRTQGYTHKSDFS